MADENKQDQEINEEVVKDQTEASLPDDDVQASSENEDVEHPDKKSSKKKKTNKSDDQLKQKEKENEELRYKMSEINDKYLRLSAEFDNYRKRTLKEKSDLIRTSHGDVLVDILPVVDDFERALKAMEQSEDIQAVKDGVSLIYNKFREFMKGKGIKEIEALNQDFDTDRHEALTKVPAPEEGLKGKVIDVVQKGYMIDEKVVRFAKVVIGE